MAPEKPKREKERGGKRGKGEGEVIEVAEIHGLCSAPGPVTFTSSVKEFLNVITVDPGGWVMLCLGGVGEAHPWSLPSRCH